MSTNTHTIKPTLAAVATAQTNQDFKNALLIVSVVANLFVLTAWMVAQLSAEYAGQLANLI
jgi:hypothetical protein